MKKFIIFIAIFFISCSNLTIPKKNQLQKKCFFDNSVAPNWMCQKSIFQSIAYVKTKHNDIMSQELAYTKALQNLILKLQKKIKTKNPKILKEIKAYVIINANEIGNWFDKKHNLLYAAVKIDKKNFLNFLEKELKIKIEHENF